jgi:hypothetical protein
MAEPRAPSPEPREPRTENREPSPENREPMAGRGARGLSQVAQNSQAQAGDSGQDGSDANGRRWMDATSCHGPDSVQDRGEVKLDVVPKLELDHLHLFISAVWR